MSEHETLKKQVKDSFKESFRETSDFQLNGEVPIELPRPITQIKESIDDRIEAEAIGRDFLEQLQPIVASRKKLKEAEEDLAAKISQLCTIFPQLIASLSSKVDAVADLRRENIMLEREVLTLIKNEITK
jgi:hypothetical protein